LRLLMNNFPPFSPVQSVGHPGVGLVKESEVGNDEAPPGGVVAALWSVSAEAGEEGIGSHPFRLHDQAIGGG